MRTLTFVLLIACGVTGCSGDGGDVMVQAPSQARAASSPIRDLSAVASPDGSMLTYGADLVRLYPPETPLPPDLSRTHVVLTAWPVEYGPRGPTQLVCGGASGPGCRSCHGTSCTSGPPPPVLSPQANGIALRQDLQLPAGSGPILVDGAATMLVVAGGTRGSLADVAAPVWSWVRLQNREMVFHVYNLVDASGQHALDDRVLVIPVAR